MLMYTEIDASFNLLMLINYLSVFTVQASEQAIKFRLGEIIRTDFEPSVHFQVPPLSNVKKFTNKILILDSRLGRCLTSEKKNVTVDSYVKWQVDDVKRCYTAVAGDNVSG